MLFENDATLAKDIAASPYTGLCEASIITVLEALPQAGQRICPHTPVSNLPLSSLARAVYAHFQNQQHCTLAQADIHAILEAQHQLALQAVA